MDKAAKPRLKVFQSQFGFYETVVAAPSRAAALRAWGTHQNLFATGRAWAATDKAAAEAALAHPGTALRRAVGSNGAFALEPTTLPKVPDAPKQRANTETKARPPPRPDRSKLDAAEAALREIDERREHEEADFRLEEQALEQRRRTAHAAHLNARKAATAALVAAREAYRRGGGRD